MAGEVYPATLSQHGSDSRLSKNRLIWKGKRDNKETLDSGRICSVVLQKASTRYSCWSSDVDKVFCCRTLRRFETLPGSVELPALFPMACVLRSLRFGSLSSARFVRSAVPLARESDEEGPPTLELVAEFLRLRSVPLFFATVEGPSENGRTMTLSSRCGGRR
jgi:hypothetical protein